MTLGRSFLLLAGFCLLGPAFPSRAATQEQAGACLSVRATASGLPVYLDTLLVGTAPFDSLPIPSGQAVLRVLSPGGRAWTGPVLIETLAVRPGDHLLREIRLPGIRRITSEPFGARVHLRDSLLGSTPLLLSPHIAGEMVRVSRDGYEEASVPLTGDLHVVLVPLVPAASPYLASEPARNMTQIYLTTGATVIAGATAAYCKIKADSYYADYRRTGSSADLDKVRQLDLLSGISLVVSELSLFVLTYQLLSR